MRPVLGFRSYRHGDFDAIEPRADFAAEQAALGWPLRRHRPPGIAWTLTRNDLPHGCGGVAYDRTERVWRAWAYLSHLSRAEWGHALRMAARALAYVDQHAGVDIEASGLATHLSALRVLQRLGFSPVRGGDFTCGGQRYLRMIREVR